MYASSTRSLSHQIPLSSSYLTCTGTNVAMAVTQEVTSLEVPDLHQQILEDEGEVDDGKIVVYVLKHLDHDEMCRLA